MQIVDVIIGQYWFFFGIDKKFGGKGDDQVFMCYLFFEKWIVVGSSFIYVGVEGVVGEFGKMFNVF